MAGFGSPEQETLGPGGDAGEAAAHLSASEFKARVEARKEKVQPGTAAPNAQKQYMPLSLSRRELEAFKGQNPEMKPNDALTLHREVNAHGKPPMVALTDAMKNNQVVGFGDMHIEPSPHNDLLIEALPQLKAAGATHFAVEMHPGMKPILDQLKHDGHFSDANKDLLRGQYKHPEAFINILETAQKNGLQIVPVDSDYGDKRDRNTAMADNISGILKDKNAKVVFFVGAEHIEAGTDMLGDKTAGQQLKDRGISLSTFYPGLASSDRSGLMPLSLGATEPVAVSTRESPDIGNLDISKELKLPSMTVKGEKVKDWDNVIIYPAKAGTDAVAQEIKAMGSDPKKAILDAVQSNQVVGMGSLDWEVPVGKPQDPQAKLLESMLPELKAKGITHIAVDLPTDKAWNPLASLDKTGKVDLNFLPMQFNQFNTPEVASFLEKAHQLGIQVVPVASSGLDHDLQHQSTVAAQNVSAIVHEPGKNNKVLFFTQSSNLQDHRQNPFPNARTTADILRNNGIKLATVSSIVPGGSEALPLVAERVSQPVAVASKQAPRVASLHNTMRVDFRQIDELILYPNHSESDEKIVYPAPKN
jgi:hypothetical protein